MHIRLYKIRRILINHWHLFVSMGVVILLFGIVSFIYSRFNQQKKEIELLSSEVQTLKNRYDTLRYNKSITEDQIKEYNKLLASLVPESENYFSIIYALEQISTSTSFDITDYIINAGKSTSEKMTITATGKGDPEAFLAFLKEYKFSGGRLVTSDKIQYGGETSSKTRIALTFYNKAFTLSESMQVPQLSKEEIAKLEAIKQKIKFQFSSGSYQSADTEYPVKNNPFTSGTGNE